MFFLVRNLKTNLFFSPHEMHKLHSQKLIIQMLRQKMEGVCFHDLGYLIKIARDSAYDQHVESQEEEAQQQNQQKQQAKADNQGKDGEDKKEGEKDKQANTNKGADQQKMQGEQTNKQQKQGKDSKSQAENNKQEKNKQGKDGKDGKDKEPKQKKPEKPKRQLKQFIISTPQVDEYGMKVSIVFSAIFFKAQKGDIIQFKVDSISEATLNGRIGPVQLIVPLSMMEGFQYKKDQNVFVSKQLTQNSKIVKIDKGTKVRAACIKTTSQYNINMKILCQITKLLQEFIENDYR